MVVVFGQGGPMLVTFWRRCWWDIWPRSVDGVLSKPYANTDLH